MRRRLTRTWLRGVAALVAALMLQGSLDAFHLAKGDDPDFGPIIRSVASHGPRLAPSAGEPASDPHCAICHWLRSLSTTQVAVRLPYRPPACAAGQPFAPAIHSCHLARTHFVVRGPPLA
jgi:hypothetical protein